MGQGLDYGVAGDNRGLAHLGNIGRSSWLDAAEPSPTFTAVVDDELITARTDALTVATTETLDRAGGVVEDVTTYEHLGDARIRIEWHLLRYPGPAVVETWICVRNLGDLPVAVRRLDSIALDLAPDAYDLLSFTSAWGAEFGPVKERLTHERRLESLAGRSSHGHHPWFALTRADGGILAGAPVWSGNWIFRMEPRPGGGLRLSGGLHDEGFEKILAPGQSVEAPHVVLALGADSDLNSVSVPLARLGRSTWAPRSSLAQQLPVEWNHWWSYEDRDIDEKVFRANVDAAAEIGVEVCTLDAGWFGPSDPEARWTDYRGDWDDVNAARFPSGIRALSDYTHDHGIRFGLWCEIEAIGPKARVAAKRPDLPAQRDAKPLGYVCLGNPDAVDWAVATLEQLADEFGADWIKLDFNLDPGLGCDRTDHGHGRGDGLFEHYLGYYRALARVRESHPDLVLENCSSGGLRIDLGILRQTHMTFLSDPDWPEHGLQLLWGASCMLAPSQLLHWGLSQWRGNHPQQRFDPLDDRLRPHQVDYYRRIAMVGATGFSYALPDLPQWLRDQLATNIASYKTHVRRFVGRADLRRLTGQPERFGRGDRWAAFQYSLPDGDEHLVLAFRLPGGEPSRTLHLRALDPDHSYDITWVDARRTQCLGGASLMSDGATMELPEEGSELLLLRRR